MQPSIRRRGPHSKASEAMGRGVARCLDRFASPHLTFQTIWARLEPPAAMTTTGIRDVPKEQIFGPMAMVLGMSEGI